MPIQNALISLKKSSNRLNEFVKRRGVHSISGHKPGIDPKKVKKIRGKKWFLLYWSFDKARLHTLGESEFGDNWREYKIVRDEGWWALYMDDRFY